MKHKMMSGALIAALVGWLTLVAFAQGAEPDATLVLTSKSVAAGVGFSWGAGR